MSLPLNLHQPGFFQNTHVMRDRGLRQFHAVFNFRCAQGSVMGRVSEQMQDSASRGIGNGMQEALKIGVSVAHVRSVPEHRWS